MGAQQVCAIFMAFDEIAHKNSYITLTTPKRSK